MYLWGQAGQLVLMQTHSVTQNPVAISPFRPLNPTSVFPQSNQPHFSVFLWVSRLEGQRGKFCSHTTPGNCQSQVWHSINEAEPPSTQGEPPTDCTRAQICAKIKQDGQKVQYSPKVWTHPMNLMYFLSFLRLLVAQFFTECNNSTLVFHMELWEKIIKVSNNTSVFIFKRLLTKC